MLFAVAVNNHGDNEYVVPLGLNVLTYFLEIVITSPAAGIAVNVTVVKPAFTV